MELSSDRKRDGNSQRLDRREATAELRSGLGQGYLPITEGGQHVLLIQSPRALRGGLSFIF